MKKRMMNKCPKCNFEFEGNFCPNCGARFGKPERRFNFEALKKYKGWIIGSVVIIAAIAFIVAFIMAVLYKFRAPVVEKIELGATQEQVLDILGEPYAGSKTDYSWEYYDRNYTDLLAKIDKNVAEQEKATDLKDLLELAEEELKLISQRESLVTRRIVVGFDSEKKVTSVELDTQYCESTQFEIKKIVGEVKLSSYDIPRYAHTVHYATAGKLYYTDGSYCFQTLPLSIYENLDTSVVGSQKIECSSELGKFSCVFNVVKNTEDDYGIYTQKTIKSKAKRSDGDCKSVSATYWYSCTDCDEVSNVFYFDSGSVHTYTKQTVDSSTQKSAATCISKATYWSSCEVCDEISDSIYFESGNYAVHDYTKQTAYDTTKRSDGDCTHKATYWYSCKGCGKISNELYFENDYVHNYVNGICTVCNALQLYTKEDNYIYFGSWPQSEETDSGVISTLNSKYGALPTNGNNGRWTSYEYYIGDSNTTDFMWYIDIDLDEDGSKDYRGVYFTSYRPYYTSDSSTSGNTYQYENGYDTERVYWFKWEPIKWRILTEESGNALLLCEMLIDSQQFDNDSNNYANSEIRAWLKDTFYKEAFTELQKGIIQLTTVDNSVASTGYSSNEYACENTQDSVFLLSYKEATNSEYGFTGSATEQKKTTAYAQCQGAYTYDGGSYDGNGWWWLRSPYDFNSRRVRTVYYDGYIYNYGSGVYSTDGGVCPALWISL